MLMENEIIKVSGLCKTYDIYDNPSDRIKELLSPSRKKYSSSHVALTNISFSIHEGEFVGVVGKNGAGKSTLLKILSGRLTQSSGNVDIRGSISLLQLGLGFNKELTGLENIKFSAKLLGHDDDKVESIINDVIEFADIGEFIHHPVKTYSSGMYSRLSFAVGITSDPDILVVDEVLSVGDMRFAAKCLRKMHEIKDNGKTVILVTHDTGKIATFCDRAIWLHDARVEAMGEAKEVATMYRDYMLMGKRRSNYSDEISDLYSQSHKQNDLITEKLFKKDIIWDCIEDLPAMKYGNVAITHLAIYSKNTGKRSTIFMRGEKALLYLKIKADRVSSNIVVGWNLIDKSGLIAVHDGSNYYNNDILSLDKDSEVLCCFEFKVPSLRNSEYSVTLGLREGDAVTYKINDVTSIQITGNEICSSQGGYVILNGTAFVYQ